jgi:Tfp pilus assembly protein PilX
VAASGTIAAPAPVGTTTSGGGALKIILIIVAVIAVLGVMGMSAVGFVAWRVSKNIHNHIRQEGNNVKVETPFGTVESTKDPEAVARNLGVDIYPGAQVQKEGNASATFGGIHSVSAHFESPDSMDKVSEFYKSKYPNALTTTDSNRCTIISNDRKNMITINMESNGRGTQIEITNVSHPSSSSN